jgi:hypothetical protein
MGRDRPKAGKQKAGPPARRSGSKNVIALYRASYELCLNFGARLAFVWPHERTFNRHLNVAGLRRCLRPKRSDGLDRFLSHFFPIYPLDPRLEKEQERKFCNVSYVYRKEGQESGWFHWPETRQTRAKETNPKTG